MNYLFERILQIHGAQVATFLESVEAVLREQKDRLAQGGQEGWDPEFLADEFHDFWTTSRLLYATLAVVAYSSTEHSLKALLNAVERREGSKKNDGLDGKELSNKWKDYGVQLEELPGYVHLDLLRLLSNCFKHREGRASKQLLEAADKSDKAIKADRGGDAHDQKPQKKLKAMIAYEMEDWPELLRGRTRFINAVSERVLSMPTGRKTVRASPLAAKAPVPVKRGRDRRPPRHGGRAR